MQALQASEQRYRTLFESMDEGYCIIEMIFDPPHSDHAVDYRFLEVNPAFEAQAGMRDVTGKRMLEFVPSIEEHWLKNYGRVARTGESIRFANEYKTLNRWFDVYAFRVGTPEDPKVAVLFTDITGRKRAEAALQESDRRKDEFIATLAHELRNPLAPIRNGLQIMKLAADDPELLEEARTMMDRQLDQMVHLVDDLLDVSRISRGKIRLKKERVLLTAAIRSALETTRPLVEAAGHRLTVNVPPEPIYVNGDSVRLSQIFSNLLNNAVKYTESSGCISLNVERRGDEVIIQVKDNGIGIPAPMISKVFEMFTQVDHLTDRSKGGLGIGLSIVGQLVEMHGGMIEAHSDGPGTGSEFTVRLPTVEAPRSQDPVTTVAAPSVHEVRRRVLVVDDNRDAATSLASLLRLAGADIRTAHDGLQAIDVASTFRPDLILLDIGMPNMNGYETARQIRAQAWGGDVQIVALTGWGQSEDKRQAMAAGFNSHLVKPASAAVLQDLLRQLSS
jgi:PAS domain S-box-containing protein